MNSNEPVGARAADDATLDLAFALQRNPGAYALVIGAGVSTEAGMPSAWDVQVALLREVVAGLGVRTDDVVAWWRCREGSDPRYDDLIERLAPSVNERQALLRGFFEPTVRERQAGEKAPSAAHRSIARLVVTGRVRIVVTLNFDHLIETALLDAGVVPTVVSAPAEFAALPPLHAQSALVVHLHGEYTNPSSLLNTGDELSEYDARTHDLMARIAAEYGLVFVGWSGVWDQALRDIVATNPNRFYTSWWVNRSPLQKPAEDLRSLRGGLVIRDAAQAALGRLADATDALAFTNARHPRAAAVAVASAKRALEGGHRAIGLHDELVSEFERLAADPALAAGAARPRAEQTAIVEEAVRVLVPLVATTAYWGTSTTDAWWRDEIPGIATGDGASTGAATVLLWAAGVATVAAKRLDLTHDLLTNLTIGIPGQGHVGAAEALAPDRTLSFPGAAAWLAETLHRPLAELTGLGERSWGEAFALFSYLQLLERAFARIDDAVIDGLRSPARQAWEAHPWGPSLVAPGSSPEELELRRAIRACAPLDLPIPHLRGGGYGSRWYPSVSAQLRREFNLQEAGHPLVQAGFADGDACTFRTMVSITDEGIAQQAKRLAAATGAVAESSLWLDQSTTAGPSRA